MIILCLRLGWFGLSPSDRWPSFLDGFAFTIQDDHILLSDNGELREIEIPHWWHKENRSHIS